MDESRGPIETNNQPERKGDGDTYMLAFVCGRGSHVSPGTALGGFRKQRGEYTNEDDEGEALFPKIAREFRIDDAGTEDI